jgi:hypothetical protein
MTGAAEQSHPFTPRPSIIKWLMDSDPAIRWQVMRDLTDESDDMVASERARIAREGWGAELLALQSPEGHWNDAPDEFWMRTIDTLFLLTRFGLDPQSDVARTAISRVRENLRWEPLGGRSFFDGETEPCLNGRILAAGAYFGEPANQVLERLLSEQLEDGGWNCDAPPSVRSSFHTTICVLEGLLQYEHSVGADPTVTEARQRGQEYLLERRMLRSLSTGEIIDKRWTRFAFPLIWHYDLLRGLDYLRSAGDEPDERVDEAVEIVAKRAHKNNKWPLHVHSPERVPFHMEPGQGNASRWNTLRALRVLRWHAERLQ